MVIPVACTVATQRIEIITGTGRRKNWTPAERAQLLREAFSERGAVSRVARQYGISPSLLYRWRRQALRGALDPAPAFVPVQMLPAVPDATPVATATLNRADREARAEIVLGNGRILRVAEDIAAANLARLAQALDPR